MAEEARASVVSAPSQDPVPQRDVAPYRVTGIERRTATIAEVWLRPVADSMTFRPGEYVLLEARDRQVPPRSYSIANAPRADGAISLLVTRVPGGQTSTWIHDRLRVADEVAVTGPYGTFVADPASRAPGLYLAAGSGLAPIRALVEAALEGSPPRSLLLAFSARTEADVLDRQRFARWRARHRHFRFIRTLTREAGPDPHGRIPQILPALCPDLAAHEVFIAGAPGFVGACASAAKVLGAAPDRVHTEPFFVEQ